MIHNHLYEQNTHKIFISTDSTYVIISPPIIIDNNESPHHKEYFASDSAHQIFDDNHLLPSLPLVECHGNLKLKKKIYSIQVSFLY